MTDLDALRYPVGRFEPVTVPLGPSGRAPHLKTLDETPPRLRALVQGLRDADLERQYRPGGWTIRQVIHHLPDSHMNAYIRMKLAVTEVAPAIRTYEEQLWAELPEAKSGPVELSLALLEALHRRWLAFLTSLTEEQFARPFVHPEWGRVSVEASVALYAWHCRHHTAHVQQALEAATV